MAKVVKGISGEAAATSETIIYTVPSGKVAKIVGGVRSATRNSAYIIFDSIRIDVDDVNNVLLFSDSGGQGGTDFGIENYRFAGPFYMSGGSIYGFAIQYNFVIIEEDIT